MSDDIDGLAAMDYESDPNPVNVAVGRVTALLIVWDQVRKRPPEIGPLPVWQDTSAETAAGKIVADLLNVGWSPPTEEEIAAAVARSVERERRFDEWKATLSPEQWAIVVEHYSQTGEYPPAWQPPRDGPR